MGGKIIGAGNACQHGDAMHSGRMPGLKIMVPATPSDAKGLLRAAIRDPNPVVFLENEILYGKSFEVPKIEDWLVPIGKARIARVGHHVTIVSFGIGMTYALAAAEALLEIYGLTRAQADGGDGAVLLPGRQEGVPRHRFLHDDERSARRGR